MSAQLSVSVQEADFETSALQKTLLAGSATEGAVATFTGYVRSEANNEIDSMTLEHYPGMTEKSITKILEQAAQRWPVSAAGVVHRVGTLKPGDQIVWVGVASAHRAAAFSACEFLMDYLKTRAPFWKKEQAADGSSWVEAKASDDARADRWG